MVERQVNIVSRTTLVLLVGEMKTVDKNKIHIYTVEHNAFTASVATSFGRFDYHQANFMQNVKRLVTRSA
jgi:hypothetical protein